MEQFAFEFMRPAEPIVPPTPIADALVAAGITPSGWHMSTYGGPSDYDVPAPSRLYQFPLEYFPPDREGVEGIYLLHPGLSELPIVKRVSDVIGFDVPYRETDEYGRPFGNLGQWWHAVDLMTEKHHQHLLDTRNFTTREDILNAVVFALEYGNIKVPTARRVMVEMGQPEPTDRSRARLVGDGMWPSLITMGSSGKAIKSPTDYALNVKRCDDAGWMLIHGLEDGWLHRPRSGHLSLTPMAVRERAANDNRKESVAA